MENKVSLIDIANGIATKKGITKKEAESFVRCLFDVVCDSLKNDKTVKIKGFGTFKLIMMESRESINVNNGERILINGYTKVSFTPDATLRDVINKPFAQFDTVLLYDGTKTEDMECFDKVTNESSIENDVTSESVGEIINDKDIEMVEQAIESPVSKKEEYTIKDQLYDDKIDNITNEPPKETFENIKSKTDVNTPTENAQKESIVSKEIPNKPLEKNNKNKKIWITLLLLLIGVVCYICSNHISFIHESCPNSTNKDENLIQVIDTNEVKVIQNDSVKADTLISVVDSIAYPQIANGEFKIIGTKAEHKLKNGETLRTVSLKYYGTKEYSEYIVVYNQIEAPDLVPIGMVIKIPELQKK